MASTGKIGARNGCGSKGVITRVPMSVGIEELKRNIKGGKIMNAQRLLTTKDIEKKR